MKTDKSALTFRKGDAVAIAAVVITALAMMAYFLISAAHQSGKTAAKVYLNGEMIREISMDRDSETVVQGEYRNVITVRDGKVSVTESDCPGADCVHTGWIRSAGRSIVCLPNRMEVRVEGAAGDDDVDAVIQ